MMQSLNADVSALSSSAGDGGPEVVQNLTKRIKKRFGECLKLACEGALEGWKDTVRGKLALLLIFGQFLRSVYPNSPSAYTNDEQAGNPTRQIITQVLDSSTVAAVVGQSVKRFTSAAFGKGFNLKLIIWWNAVYPFCGYRILALSYGGRDRRGNRNGFGKGLLGFFIRFTVIVAALFMYDGQASQTTAIYDDLALIGKPSPTVDNGENQLDGVAAARTQEFYRAAEKLPSVKEGQVTLQELGDESGSRHIPLRESVGHTKLEVLVGAIWGIVTALALHSSFEL